MADALLEQPTRRKGLIDTELENGRRNQSAMSVRAKGNLIATEREN
jgi:hypothetical protein